MKKYLTKLFRDEYKFLFKTLNSSNKSAFEIDFITLNIKKNTALGKKNDKLSLPLDELITPRVFNKEKWDYFIIKFIKNNIKFKTSVFFDVGANIGLISRQLQNLNLCIKKYYCFEPELNSFKILKKNLLEDKTIFFNFGLSSKTKYTKMYINNLNKSDNSIYIEKYKNKKNNYSNILLKDSNTILKKIIKKDKLSNIIYKSDTQGMDEEIFLNLGKEILDHIYILIIEISNFDFLEKNIDKFLMKIKKFNKIFNENQKQITCDELKSLILKKKEFNIMAKK